MMEICITKAMLYTVQAAIPPAEGNGRKDSSGNLIPDVDHFRTAVENRIV